MSANAQTAEPHSDIELTSEDPACAVAVLTYNTGSRITGWLAWHLALGCTRILVVDGGSKDGTKQYVSALEKEHPVEWHSALEPPASNLTWEEAAQRRSFLSHYAFEALQQTQATWLAVLDSDEYLAPEPTLQALLQRGKAASAIALNWCVFGSSGHRNTPKGHIAATHPWRADHALIDHHLTRIIIRSDYFTQGKLAQNKIPALQASSIIHADGTFFTASPPTTADQTPKLAQNPVNWKGGRLLHYIFTDRHHTPHLQVSDSSKVPLRTLRNHFDRNDIQDDIAQSFLPATRIVQNALWRSNLENGIIHLKQWATAFIQAYEKDFYERTMQKEGSFFLEKTRRSGENFSYMCQRFRPNWHDRLLLSPQATPPYGINKLFILYDASSAAPLTEDSSTPERALIGMVQNTHPRLLCLFRFDGQPFTLGDCPCPHNMAALLVKRTQHTNFFALPEETGRSGRLFEAVDYTISSPPDMAYLPVADTNTGLSLEGFLFWVDQHPAATPQDFSRILLLLKPEAATLVIQTLPELAVFLPQS